MKRILQTFIVAACAAVQMYAAIDPREVWFDPNGTALASAGATGTLSNPLGGSGANFDANMRYLCAGDTNNVPIYTNLVIHLKAGTYETTGWVYNHNFLSGAYTKWLLRKGQSLVGEGMESTIIRRSNPNNDLYYVVGSWFGETGVEIADLTVDANYSASTDTTISVGGINMWHLGRVRGVKVTGTSGNTSAGPTNEFFSLRMGGSTPTGARDQTATGGLIENCVVTNVRGGYISGINASSGQTMVVNNHVFMPHFTTPTGTDNPGHPFGIGASYAVNSTIMGNFVSGGYLGFYNDSGNVTNLVVAANHFVDVITGVQIFRGSTDVPANPFRVQNVNITDNFIDLSTDSNVSDERFGVKMHSEYTDSGYYINRPLIRGNRIRGGVTASLTTGIHLEKVNYPECYDNRLHNIGDGGNPSLKLQTYFETVGGRIYNLFTHQGAVVSPEKWLMPWSSDWMTRKTIPSSDPSTSYAVFIGDKYIGLQKAGFTVSLPDAASYAGKEIVIVNETGTTLTGSVLNCSVGGQTINGASSVSLAAPYTSVRVTSNGSAWIRF